MRKAKFQMRIDSMNTNKKTGDEVTLFFFFFFIFIPIKSKRVARGLRKLDEE